MPKSRLEGKNLTLFNKKNDQNQYLICDQNGRKTLPFEAAHTYLAHVREYPPGTVGRIVFN